MTAEDIRERMKRWSDNDEEKGSKMSYRTKENEVKGNEEIHYEG